MSFNLVSEQLPATSDLKHQDLSTILGQLTGRRLDYGDLYFQSSYHESWVLEDRITKSGSYDTDQGIGVRAINGEKTGFACIDQISLLTLEQSAQTARTIIRDSGSSKIQTLDAIERSPLYVSVDSLQSTGREEKLSILRRVGEVARETDKRVQEVTASLSGVYELTLVVVTSSTLTTDVRPLVRLSASVLVKEDGRRERDASDDGGHSGYEFFLADLDGEVRTDVRVEGAMCMALINLSAVVAPAGIMSVILDVSWPDVLLHEAVGHGLGGDFNRRDTSVSSGQAGELVASELCTVVDDDMMVDCRGSVAIDDGGTPGQYNALIEDSILKGYMQDKSNARLMGMTPVDNDRRESRTHLLMPRMTNTYVLPGRSTPREIIESVKYGIYAPNFGGGQMDITSDKSAFSTSGAHLIENDKATRPVRGTTLIGSSIKTMQQIPMVGNDLKLDNGMGVCGKEGQSLPVGIGQPTLKVDNLTVGGTA